MTFDPKAWLGQATTGGGIAALLGTLAAVASGQMTWQHAVPLLVAGAVGLLWPENKPAQQGASTLAGDMVQFLPVLFAAFEHGKSAAPAAAPAAPAPAPVTTTQGA